MLMKENKKKEENQELSQGEIWMIELNKIIIKTQEQNRALEKLIREKRNFRKPL